MVALVRRWGLLGCLLVSLPLQAQTLTTTLGGEPHLLQLVADPDSRRQGLMGRAELNPGEGMLFDFPAGTRPAIWMRNMQLALDLLFVDDQARLVHVFPRVPPCASTPCDVYQADRPLRFVIEVPAGTAERLGLRVGDQLDLAGRESSPPPPY